MSKRITYDMAKTQKVAFDYWPDPAYLAIVDLDSYRFFVKAGLEYDGMLAHLGRQMAERTCVAWGCPERKLRVQLSFARDHKRFELVRKYAAGFQSWVRTRGRLCFTSHADLYHCAVDPEWSLFKGPESPDIFLPRELLVPPGMYSIIVFRQFPWFEGAQDAPLGEGIHYTVILRHCADKSHLGRLYPPSPVPWTSK